MTNEAVVAYMLLRFKTEQPPPLPPPAPAKPVLHLGWTVRQRRSRSAPKHGDGKKKPEAARASPTTPLSWSGGTSVSGGVLDGSEESSRPVKPTDGSRSKVTVTCETTTTTTTTKRARKKKSLAELREEESLLLKERRNLKNELAKMRLTLDKQRAANESWKRIKLDLQSQQTLKATTEEEAIISERPQEREQVCDPASILPTGVICNNIGAVPHTFQSKSSCSKIQELRDSEASSILLPDLNLPFEEESGSEVLYGMS